MEFSFWSLSCLDAPDGFHDRMEFHDLFVTTLLQVAREDLDIPESLPVSSKAKAGSPSASSPMVESSPVSPGGGFHSKKGMKSWPSSITGVSKSQQSPRRARGL